MNITVTHTEFAAQLRKAGLTQVQFARLCGVTPMAVNHWYKGRYSVPRWAWALANAASLVPLSKLSPAPTFPWFDVLGVTADSTVANATTARSKLAKRYHPDLGGDTAAMQRINAAFDTAKRLCS